VETHPREVNADPNKEVEEWGGEEGKERRTNRHMSR